LARWAARQEKRARCKILASSRPQLAERLRDFEQSARPATMNAVHRIEFNFSFKIRREIPKGASSQFSQCLRGYS